MHRNLLVNVCRLLVLGLLLVAVLGFSPVQQADTPDVNDLVVYGVPWMVIVIVTIGLLRKYAGMGDEVSVLVSAGGTVLGFLLVQNLPDLESVLPWLPKYVPQVLWAIVLFGAQLGLVPGTTASRVTTRITSAISGKE